MLSICIFQSTPPARWWPLIFPSSSQDVDFNPHHPQGGDMDEVLKTELIRISIHTTRKVVTMTWPVVDICLLFQSTPPARWWPFLWWIKRGLYQISIHTTRKVVTPFQHTMVQPWNFNPHHPQGGDNPDRGGNCINCISIHTTRKVVTHLLLQTQCRLCISIHTTRKVVTGMSWTGTIRSGIFQSTPPARWWRFRRRADSKRDNFNPHHPQGGDQGDREGLGVTEISIHTTRKVVTFQNLLLKRFLLFQSTPPARWWLMS